ncbi:membrane lipoprotein lipid attachment site-containing protein [Bacillus sp. B-jedd]|uniref:membrane lipoprotein lipid attachment site-containing protein n=1 Tax=Bacillus sp. B-jedd TaxID=1476857 RepID=UPI0005155C31|nr:membrane lipoprotein lipid attachment site-containing protein [Bacillus sp. B-jedd]CEG26194.1 hypothetical protein BN1002_01035 [Bacillus sp. B-jedd]
MRKILFLFALVILLSGCRAEPTFSEVSEKSVNKNVKAFVHEVRNRNGVHLYFNGEKEVYVYLNGSNAKQGGKGMKFTDFDVKGKGETLNILYNKATVEEGDQSINNPVLYRIKLDKKYENVKPFGNGKEVTFGVVSGNQ